jgi:peptidoglycan/LPS O-acetylase OafA/YrhL
MLRRETNYLDGLRGLAALLVVFLHYATAFYPAFVTANYSQIHTKNGIELFIAKSPLDIFYAGNFAVCIFFVLSGYVLSVKYFQFKNQNILVKSAIKRYFRLVIPVFASVSIAFILMKLSLFNNIHVGELTHSQWWLSTFWNFNPGWLDYIKQALFGALLFKQSSFNPVLWTMTYEFYGSFIVFGLASLFGNLKKRYILYFFAVILVIKLDVYYLGFILGMALSDLVNSEFNLRSKINHRFLIGIILLVGLFLGSTPRSVDLTHTIYSFLKISFVNDYPTFYQTIGAFLIMTAILLSDKFQAMLSHKTILFLGEISYSMYLIHFLILGSFSCIVFLDFFSKFRYSMDVGLTFILSLCIIIPISAIMTRYVDANGIKFANYIYERFFDEK